MVSVGQESGRDLAGRVCLRSLPMLWSHLKVHVGQDRHSSSLTHVAAGGVTVLVGCWLEAVLTSYPRGSLHRLDHNVAAGFHPAEQAREGEKECAQAF